MGDFITTGAVILLLIMIGAVFVMTEIAVIASRKARLEKLKQDGVSGAQKALDLVHKPESFLATVQVVITLVSILIGLYSGATVAEPLTEYVNNIEYLSEEWRSYIAAACYGIMAILITYFTVLGEIIPKRIALIYPEKISVAMARLMIAMSMFLYPLIWCLDKSTRFFIWLFGIKKPESALSTEELKFLIKQAGTEGLLEKTGTDMLRRLVNLGNTQVGAIMTPRSSMIYLDLQEPRQAWFNKMQQNPFNNFPLVDGALNNLVGIVSVKELFNAHLKDENFDIRAQAQPVFYVPEVAKVTKLMEMFREKKLRIAIVLDEYGDVEGLVTLNDIVKTFMGEMAIFIEGRGPDITHKQDGSILMRGSVLIEEVMDLLNISALPGQEDEDYRTLASFMLSQFDHMPQVGDGFAVGEWLFKVVKMDNFRIERVRVKKIQKEK